MKFTSTSFIPATLTVPGTAFELKPAPTLPPDAGSQSFESLLSFLDVQAPEVARIVREADLPERARRNTIRLLVAMASSPERFAPARAKPATPAARHRGDGCKRLPDGTAGSSSRRHGDSRRY